MDVNRISGKENNQFRLHDIRFEVASGPPKKIFKGPETYSADPKRRVKASGLDLGVVD